jgi:hypothetical protein
VRALKALEAAGLIEMRWMMPAHTGRLTELSADARRLVGLWPTPRTSFDRLLAALEREADAGRLRRPGKRRSRLRGAQQRQ